jgi:hypothetical protein
VNPRSRYHQLDDGTFIPVGHHQLRALLAGQLTVLDAMNLPDRTRAAVKRLLTEAAWRWWDLAAENAITSTAGHLAPIVITADRAVGGHWSNRWGWVSHEEYLASLENAAE